MDKVEDVLTRGVEKILPSKEGLAKLMGERKIKLYQGFDPSSPNLHLGNLIGIRKLAQFQKLGHKVIFLIGDFTGMIGDPTNKKATRIKLTKNQVVSNAKDYKNQISNILSFEGKNKAEIKYNSEWLSKLKFEEIVDLASNFTIQQMLERNTFRNRLKTNIFQLRNSDGKLITKIICRKCGRVFDSPIQFGNKKSFETAVIINNRTTCKHCGKIFTFEKSKPVYLHEFFYPLMQGYDSVKMGVDLEIGGNDQLFNMLAGRNLMKTLKNKEKYVLTMKLLSDPTGVKMGKTEGNTINLNDKPVDMFRKVLKLPEELLELSIELLTDLPLNSVKNNAKKARLDLAYSVVRQIYGNETAKLARNESVHRYRENKKPTLGEVEITPQEFHKTTSGTISGASGYPGTLKLRSMASGSISDAKRIINQGGVTVYQGDELIKLEKDEEMKDLNIKAGDFIKVGESVIAVVEDKK